MRQLACLGVMVLWVLTVSARPAAQETAPAVSGLVVSATQAGRPVDDLGLIDFEFEVGGKSLPLEALAFVRDGEVVRREGSPLIDIPDTRRIRLLFNLTHFTPEVEAGLRDFVLKSLRPGDRVEVRTFQGSYAMSPFALEAKSREALAGEIVELVRRDTGEVSALYDDILTNLKQMTVTFGSLKSSAGVELRRRSMGEAPFDQVVDRAFPRYRDALQKLNALRSCGRLVAETGPAAPESAAWKGPNASFFFFEPGYRPEISLDLITWFYRIYQENPRLKEDLDALTEINQTKSVPDAPKLLEFFGKSDGELFLIEVPAQPGEAGDAFLDPMDEEYLKALARTAQATGGLVFAPQKPQESMRTAAEEMGTYYLLLFPVQPVPKDATFRSTKVILKHRTADLRYRDNLWAGR